MFNISTLINPLAAIDLLKRGIEKQLNEPIEAFMLMFKKDSKNLHFEIPLNSNFPNRKETKFWYENDRIISLVNSQVKQQLKKDQILTHVTLEVNKKEYIVKAFYIEKNEKKYTKLSL